jgi:hypothetical protein
MRLVPFVGPERLRPNPMGLGNNRDYKTRERKIRRNFAVINARKTELMTTGLDESLAIRQAMAEFQEGKLDEQLKAWKDPILAHQRKMRKANQ